MATIKQWELVYSEDKLSIGIQGKIYDHSGFKNGATVVTSAVESWTPTDDIDDPTIVIVTKSGSVYRLVEPRPFAVSHLLKFLYQKEEVNIKEALIKTTLKKQTGP